MARTAHDADSGFARRVCRALFPLIGLLAASVTAQAQLEFRINAGGPAYTSVGGDLFVADQPFTVGDFGFVGAEGFVHPFPVTGSPDLPLYSSLRADVLAFSYQFDNLPAADYEVTLHFAELNAVLGERQFDVLAEGNLIFDNFDIFAAAGGSNIAHQETFTVNVSDGLLNLDFVPQTANHAGIFAIEVVEQTPPGVVPSITTDPASITVTEPDAATFSVVATGTAPLSYQWRRDGVDIPGETGTSYTLDPTSVADDGATFDVVVTNAFGSATSTAATLTVSASGVAPSITTDPASITVTEPDAATFSVVATGTAPLSYQWRRDGVDIAGETGTSYTLDPTSVADDGATFDVVVTNAFGSATSTAATLTVSASGVAPSITTDPASITVTEPDAATFSVVATGTAPLSYQWRRDGVDIAGETGTSYTLDPTSVADDGATFDVVVTNAFGSATSALATLTVSASGVAPSITTDPASITVTEPDAATFSVVATGTAPLSYQWRRDGVDIAGETGTSYTLDPTSVADDGATFDVVVTNAFGSATSAAATLTVNPVGGPVEFRINAGGASDFTDINGHLFVADKAYSAGDFGFSGGSSASVASDVRDTTDDPLFQSFREGSSFSYIFDLPNDDYEIRLYFTEPTVADFDVRTFDITVEGALQRDAFDVYTYSATPWADQDPLVPRFVPTAGEGTLRAYSELLTATVADGQLNIDFDVVSGSNAILSAVAVRPLPPMPLSDYADVAAQVGVSFVNEFSAVCGVMEIGSGSAWADYDNDGDL